MPKFLSVLNFSGGVTRSALPLHKIALSIFSLACGEPEKNAQAQVHLGRPNKPTLNQQQEFSEEIGSASC